ncbi:serine protease snake-like [Battus philenor]|uniref:serine protease snake-like n=1 Tax=Battus philenor TaxID=42288 RepID=UPI0035CF8A36
MKYLIYVTLVFLISIVHCWDEIGDECEHSGVAGTCRRFADCPFARNLVLEEKMMPTNCFFEADETRVVCCPDSADGGGVPANPPADTSSDTGCQYNGTNPLVCCGIRSDPAPDPVDPGNCPTLRRPQLLGAEIQPYQQTVLDACYNYSRLGSRCVETNNSEFRGSYVRQDLCRGGLNAGDVAEADELPHTAILGYTKDSGDIEWVGGGTLISDLFILTSASATYHSDFGSPDAALLGARSKSHVSSGVRHCIAQILRHPLHVRDQILHDIALLKLDSRVIFSNLVRPACLRVPGLQITSERIVSGWSDAAPQQESVLLRGYIYEQPGSACSRKLRSNLRWDSTTMICASASNLAGKPDSCQNGSGGALIARLRGLPCSYVVVGVRSGGHCSAGVPGSYTSVLHPNYMEWVVRMVWPKANPQTQ